MDTERIVMLENLKIKKAKPISQEQWFDTISVRRPDSISTENTFDNNWLTKSIQGLGKINEFNNTILEVGCGDGSSGLAREIINQGYNYIGIDISNQSIDRMKKYLANCGDKAHLATGTVGQNTTLIQNLEPQIVVFSQTLHHIEEQDFFEVVKSLSKLIKKPSAVVVLEPNPYYPLWRFMGLYNKDFRWSQERGISRCTKKELPLYSPQTASLCINIFTQDHYL